MSTKHIISAVIVIVVIAGLLFYGGMQYGNIKSSSRGIGQFAGQMGGTGSGARTSGVVSRGGVSGGFTIGDILAKDATSITVKMRDGSTKIVFYSSTTDVQKTVDGSATDLVVGKSVSVMGITNADGSITAQSVSLRTTPLVSPQGKTQPAQ